MQPVGAVELHVQQHAQPQPRLARAAHEFEGQLMQELLKPLNQGDGLGGDEDEAGSSGALGDFASEALGQALSRHGGLGIADRIVGQLSHSGTTPGSAKVTNNPHTDTGMRSLR